MCLCTLTMCTGQSKDLHTAALTVLLPAEARAPSALQDPRTKDQRERKGYTDIADAFFCERGGSKGAPRAVPRRPRVPFGNSLNTGAGHPPHPRAREGGTKLPTSGESTSRLPPTHPWSRQIYKKGQYICHIVICWHVKRHWALCHNHVEEHAKLTEQRWKRAHKHAFATCA